MSVRRKKNEKKQLRQEEDGSPLSPQSTHIQSIAFRALCCDEKAPMGTRPRAPGDQGHHLTTQGPPGGLR
ncbi:unnamed protein product [Boreogadus saida]